MTSKLGRNVAGVFLLDRVRTNRGTPPHGVTLARDMPKHTSEVVEAPYLRTVVSRFGGVVAQGNTVSIPTTAFEIAGHGLHQPVDHTNFNQRYGPSVTTYGPGVAGYGGFKPHGTTTGNLEAHSYLSGMHEPQKQPYVMPPPGYAGHLRNANAGDATSTWGTSHWKIGQTPKGVGSPTRSPPKGPTMSPEQLAEKREMDEANELLDLRSLGIRAALKVAQPQGGGGLSF